MSYYYKDKNTGNVYSNVSSIEGAKEIKSAYRYKTLLDTTNGYTNAHQSFYIKDGSLPFFDPEYDDKNKLDRVVTKINYGYLPIFQVCISSISGKYGFSDINYAAGSHITPANTTPMLYKVEMFKRNQGEYDPEITLVDYKDANGRPKGGKVAWRVSEENLKYFNYTYRGPNSNSFDQNTSATILNNSFRQNFCTKSFVFMDETTTIPISPSIGYFIDTKPEYNEGIYCSNAFGFNIPTLTGQYSAPHFTLNINDIKANGYTNLKVKIDGFYLYANDNYGATFKQSINPQTYYVKNNAAFNSNYCQGLFYAINNDQTWDINTISPGVNYLGNGIIFSNLKKDSSEDKLVVKNSLDYDRKNYTYNDAFVREQQSLDDTNVWNHMILQYVQDNKMYTSVTAEIGECPNSAAGNVINGYCAVKCPICSAKTTNDYRDDGIHRYLICKNNNIGMENTYIISANDISNFNGKIAEHVNAVAGGRGYLSNNYSGVKVPIYLNSADANPKGYWVAANFKDSLNNSFTYVTYNLGANCSGTKQAFKMSGFSGSYFWYQHTRNEFGWNAGEWEYIPQTAVNEAPRNPKKFGTNVKITCPLCNGEGEFDCYCTRLNPDPNDNDKLDYPGRVKHKKCYGLKPDGTLDKTRYGLGNTQPYSTNTTLSRFKFYGKGNVGSFNGYIDNSSLSAIELNTKYASADWTDGSIPIPAGKEGVWCSSATDANSFTDYRDLIFGDSTKTRGTFIGSAKSATVLSNLSSNWLLYSSLVNTGYDYYYGGSRYNPDMSRLGVAANYTYDLVYKFKNEDKFGNTLPPTAQEFKSDGYSPSSGTNYTISNVILTANIDLTTANGNYLHLCYPYVTVLNNTDQNVANAGIISQMIMTYEAE